MRTVKVFVSSPRDVAPERRAIGRVISRLNAEFGRIAQFEAVRWETRLYQAHETPQRQIEEAAECDIVLGILWSRIGTPLPATFAAPDDGGPPYESGTAYELRSSIARRRRGDGPDIYVFRKSTPAVVSLGDPGEVEEAQSQWRRLEAFFAAHFVGPGNTALRAFNPFETTEEFESHAENILREWIRANVPESARAVWPQSKGSPFRGLSAFDARHAPVFFGRDRKVARAIELLKGAAEGARADAALTAAKVNKRKPFLLIVGASGSGKSSLMRAGLAPRLTTPGVAPDVDIWRKTVFRPGGSDGVFADLAQALLVRGGEDDPGGYGPALPELAALGVRDWRALTALFAEDGQAGVARVMEALARVRDEARRARPDDPVPRVALLLMIDQLEELFRADIPEETRTRFLGVLTLLAASGQVWIAATMRDDLYGALINDRVGIALKDSGATYDLAPPGDAELEEILLRSGEVADIVYEAHPRTGERLDHRLLEESRGQDVLPLLQFSLNRLYELASQDEGPVRLTHAAYEAMGGLDGAIDQAAEDVLAGLGEAETATLPKLLRQLAAPVGPGGEGERAALAIRPAPYEEIARDPAMRRLADALVDAHIMRSARGGGDARLVHLVHERIFTSWRRAREIIAAQSDFYRVRDEVETARRHWEADRRADRLLAPGKPLADAENVVALYREDLPAAFVQYVRASGRRARWRQRGIAAAAVLFAGTTVLAGGLGLAARESGRRAEENYQTARAFGDDMVQLTTRTLGELSEVRVDTIEAILTQIRTMYARLAPGSQSIDLARSRAAMLQAFAETYELRRDHTQTSDYANRSLQEHERLLQRFPDDPELSWGYSRALQTLGDLKREQARRADDPQERDALNAEALGNFERALALRETFAAPLQAAHPLESDYVRDMPRILTRIADMKRGADPDEAQRLYRRALELGVEWYRAQRSQGEARAELAWTLMKFGDLQRGGPAGREAREVRAARSAAAIRYYAQALCLRRVNWRAAIDQWRPSLDVSWSLLKIGQAEADRDNLEAAARAMAESMTIRRALYENNPRLSEYGEAYAAVLNEAGELALRRGDARRAMSYALEAAEHGTRLPDGVGQRARLVSRAEELRDRAAAALSPQEALDARAGYAAYVSNEIGAERVRFARASQAEAGCVNRLDRELDRLMADIS